MFDTAFFPTLQEIANNAKEERLKDRDIKFFKVEMVLSYPCDDKTYKYADIKENLLLRIVPITQEDLDKAKEQSNESVKENS